MAKVEVRPAEAGDLGAFAAATKYRTIKAVVGLVDGEPQAIAGVAFHPGGTIYAFSELHPPMAPYKMAIARMAQRMVKIMGETGCPVVAVEDETIADAGKFLKWCGFQHQASCSHGKVYLWKP